MLLQRPEATSQALWVYPCALVTVDEHARLPKGSWGWHRYVEARIEVVDAETGATVDVQAMAEDLMRAYTRLGLQP